MKTTAGRKLSKTKVLELITRYLKKMTKKHLGKVTVHVVPNEIENREGTWYLAVCSSAQPPTMYQYYEALADVETELMEKYDLNVWLVPTVPE